MDAFFGIIFLVDVRRRKLKTSVRKDKNSSIKQSVFTAETFGVVLVLFSAFAFVCLISRDKIFSAPGQFVNRFLLGTFGYLSYPLSLFCICFGVFKVAGKKFYGTYKQKLSVLLIVFLITMLIHAATMHGGEYSSYGEYLALCYKMADGGAKSASGGGVITGLFTYPFTALLTDVGAYVILSVLIAVAVYAVYKDLRKKTLNEKEKEEPVGSFTVEKEENPETDNYVSETADGEKNGASAKLFVANATDFELKSKKELKNGGDEIKMSFADKGLGVANASYVSGYTEDFQSKLNYIKTPVKITPPKPDVSSVADRYGVYNDKNTVVSDTIPKVKQEEKADDVPVIPLYEHEEDKDGAEYRAETFREKYADAAEYDEPVVSEPQETFYPAEENEENKPLQEEYAEDENFVKDYDDAPIAAREDETPEREETENFEMGGATPSADTCEPRDIRAGGRRARDFFMSALTGEQGKEDFGEEKSDEEEFAEPAEEKEEKPVKEIPPINREYFRPPFDLLETPIPQSDKPRENHEERMEIIKRTLEEFHVAAEPQSYIQGPSITQYAVKIPAGVIVSKILGYADNLQMRLAVKDGVRIQAPIPGKDLVGIEVANSHREDVLMRELMESPAARSDKKSALMFAIGKNLVGECVFDDLAKGVHYLVAGSTGSGKSVCLNVMIASLIMRYTPEDMRLILIDPKRVEFRSYEHLPHLMSDEIVSEPKRVIATLNWAIEEMERRYKSFEEHGGLIVDIESYNEYVASDTVAKMPRIVIVVDELADLMSVCKKDLETRIARLTAKARSAGIHLVLATQRPSVDVVTGVIKANLPSRIAFKVMNFNDSQTIMSEAGAEKLLGRGDMLYKNASMGNFERYQGAFISKMEVNNVVNFIKEHNKAYFDDDFKEYLENAVNPKQEEPAIETESENGELSDSNSEIFIKALAFAINSGKISISLIQRRFQIGYIRAAGLIDKMEQNGYIAASEGSKSRSVYITREQFEEKYGPLSDA